MVEDFIIQKSNLQYTKIIRSNLPKEESPGRVVLKLDRFALSANNITYAVFGESFQYWSFFPTVEGWGRLPVWGFANVVESAAPEIGIGERVFGFFPMASHLVVEATNIRPHAWTDGAAHRADLPPSYNQYVRTAEDFLYEPSRENEHMVLSPLFSTSYLLADFLVDNNLFDASTVLMTSASSKTAIGAAYLLKKEGLRDVTLLGLTSPRNLEFVKSLGLYDVVLTYDELASIDADAILSLDFSGNRSLIGDIHAAFGGALKYSCVIGATHWDTVDGPDATLESAGDGLAGPKAYMFHAPNQGQKRRKELGAAAFAKGLAEQWRHFSAACGAWFTIEEQPGLVAGQAVYHQFLNGRAQPEKGYVFTMREEQDE